MFAYPPTAGILLITKLLPEEGMWKCDLLASAWRLPSTRAFAVAVTLGVDAGVIGPVYRAVFRRCPHHSAAVERRRIAICDVGVQGHRGGVCDFCLSMELEGASCTDKRSERRDGGARLDAARDLLRRVSLAAAERSRICSANSFSWSIYETKDCLSDRQRGAVCL